MGPRVGKKGNLEEPFFGAYLGVSFSNPEYSNEELQAPKATKFAFYLHCMYYSEHMCGILCIYKAIWLKMRVKSIPVRVSVC